MPLPPLSTLLITQQAFDPVTDGMDCYLNKAADSTIKLVESPIVTYVKNQHPYRIAQEGVALRTAAGAFKKIRATQRSYPTGTLETLATENEGS